MNLGRTHTFRGHPGSLLQRGTWQDREATVTLLPIALQGVGSGEGLPANPSVVLSCDPWAPKEGGISNRVSAGGSVLIYQVLGIVGQ